MNGRRTVGTTAGLAALSLATLGLTLGLAACADMGGSRGGPVASQRGRCADESFPIYFARGSAELTDPARTVIASASRRVTGCRISAVDVRGIAVPDAPDAAANETLTQSRADVVAKALLAAGLPAPAFDVQVAGSARAPTRPNRREPLARRTEVVLHATPT